MLKKVNKDITKSYTLPGDFYSSESKFENVVDRIFVGSWQLICTKNSIKSINDTYVFEFIEDLIPEPLFLINQDDKFKCFSNVCTHRGNVLIDQKDKIKNHITCKYHGRKFNTCGKFVYMPETEGMQNFPTKEDDLMEFPVIAWRQFIFSSLTPLFKIQDVFSEIDSRIGWMPIEDFAYRKDLSKQYSIDANWALYCDNYLEGFHIPFVHEGLNQSLDYNNYETEIFQFHNLQIGIGNNKEECFDIPKEAGDYGKNIAAYYFWIYPNIMLNFYPWGLSINIVIPLSYKKTKIVFETYVWKEDKLNLGAGSDLNKVELEDEQIVQRVQKGVSSRFYQRGRFSPKMEKGVHHFHNLISHFLKK
tara:strand:+ start:280 stop:1362 length:1083 start_codon:yes stop_codon:yes gene_type:complete